jgi:hypothetical protein
LRTIDHAPFCLMSVYPFCVMTLQQSLFIVEFQDLEESGNYWDAHPFLVSVYSSTYTQKNTTSHQKFECLTPIFLKKAKNSNFQHPNSKKKPDRKSKKNTQKHPQLLPVSY